MSFLAIKDLTVLTNGTESIPVDGQEGLISSFRLVGATNPVVLIGAYQISPSGTPVKNQQVIFYNEANITLGAFAITIFGKTLPSSLATKNFIASFIYDGSAWQGGFFVGLEEDGWLEGSDIADSTIPLTKLANGTSAYIIVYNGSGVPVAVAMSGDMVISNAGVITFNGSPIVNADINASAAIALSKLATGTDGYLVICNGAGVPVYVASSGDVTVNNAGVFTIGAGKVLLSMLESKLLTETIVLDGSFEAAGGAVPSVGDFKVKMAYAGTLNEIYAYATKAIANTDAGTIQAKNNAGVNMTNGLITFAISDPRGTAYTVNPTANNTFVAGDILTFTFAKVTAGGRVSLSLKVTRT